MKKTFYVFSAGEFRRRDNTLYFETEAGQKRYIPVADTAEIVVFGEVNLNKRFLEFLSQQEIVLHYFNHHGYYMGTFYPREHLNSGFMVLKQAEYYLDHDKRMVIARSIIEGALKNILRVLKYYRSRGKDVAAFIDNIEKFLPALQECRDEQSLMAIEGNARGYYYKAFDRIIGQAEFRFESRTRRPPQNNLNALISFGNMMLYNLCLREIYRTHLDPRIGFLHATNIRRFTLNLDISEIFKPIIVDRLIFTLLGRQMLTANDFEKGTGGLMMKERAKRCFVEGFEEKIRTTINHREIGRPVSYRRLIRLELYKLEKHLMGEKDYVPFVGTW